MTNSIQTLQQVLPQLSLKDQDFAKSLIARAASGKALSDKQLPWVDTLIARATTPKAEPVKTDLGSFKGVIALFDAFHKNAPKLKHPKIRLQTADGKPVCLSIAGAKAKAPGTINVTDGGKFGENEWYGRIDKDGQWTQSLKAHASLAPLLKALARHPAQTAAAYGKLTGNCCFCRIPLTTAESTEVGYGPVCAKNYGLPWGNKWSI
jgi:hypothetical protein